MKNQMLTLLLILFSFAASAQTPAAPPVVITPVVARPTQSPPAAPTQSAAPPNGAASPQTPGAVGSQPNGATPSVTPTGAPATPGAGGVIDPIAEILEDYNYDPTNKRDPFAPFNPPGGNGEMIGPRFPLERYELDQLKVVGIIWDVAHPKAMVLDPNGKSYIIQKDDRIGKRNGYVAQIREGEIVVMEVVETVGRVVYQTRILKVTQE